MDKRINIRFFDENIRFIGELNNYTALIHVLRWKTYGSFEIHVPVMYDRLFQEGNIIMLNNERRKTGIIKYIGIDDKDGDEVVIKGFSLLYILTQRITIPPAGRAYHEFNKTCAEDIMIALVNANAIAPADAARKIPKLIVRKSQGRGDKLTYQTRYDGLLDALTELCAASGLGICMELDPENKQYVFLVLEGTDRSVNQQERPPMIFNINYDNISGREYIRDSSDYKNCAYTGGQGDGVDRIIKVIGAENTGINRHEMFVDARDIEDENNLPDRGNVRLTEHAKVTTYSCKADDSLYETKWNLGDIVTTKDAQWGIVMHDRVTEVEEALDANGYEVEPTFGTTSKTIIEKVNAVTGDTAKNENVKGDQGEQGIQGPQGFSLQYAWEGTKLGIKREDETSYQYSDLRGPQGIQGPEGPEGKQGPRGETGPPGTTQSYIIFQESFVSTEGQSVFAWDDHKYPLGINALSLYINGVRQEGTTFSEIDGGQSIKLKSSLPAGYKVFIVGVQMVADLQGPKGDTGPAGPPGPVGTFRINEEGHLIMSYETQEG